MSRPKDKTSAPRVVCHDHGKPVGRFDYAERVVVLNSNLRQVRVMPVPVCKPDTPCEAL